MLLGIRDFLHVWQLPLLILMLLVWFWLGSVLLLRSLARRKYPKRIRLGDCVLVMLPAALAAGIVNGAIILFFIRNLGSTLELPNVTLAIIAAVVLPLTTFIAAWLVIYAMLDLSLGAALKTALKPLLLVLIIEGALAAGAGLPAIAIRRTNLAKKNCTQNLNHLDVGFRKYFGDFSAPAPNTQTLIDRNITDAKRLQCPAAPDRENDYFYHPADMISPDTPTKKLLLCDFTGNHPRGRNVIRVNGERLWYNEDAFQQVLQLPENTDFAKALAEAEAR